MAEKALRVPCVCHSERKQTAMVRPRARPGSRRRSHASTCTLTHSLTRSPPSITYEPTCASVNTACWHTVGLDNTIKIVVPVCMDGCLGSGQLTWVGICWVHAYSQSDADVDEARIARMIHSRANSTPMCLALSTCTAVV